MVPRIGLAPFDAIFALPLPALLLSALVLTGTSQAFNLLDGLHGLCGFASLITAGGLGLIGMQAGQDQTVQVLWVVIATVGGFLLVNFPRGLWSAATCRSGRAAQSGSAYPLRVPQ